MSFEEIREVLRLDDSRVWLLIGLCVALVFTIQSVETATEGAWPHQRRPARMAPPGALRAGRVGRGGAAAAARYRARHPQCRRVALEGPAALRSRRSWAGFWSGLIWVIFVGASVNFLGMGRLLRQGGPAGPLALLVLVVAGDLLLLAGLLDVLPDIDIIRNAIPGLGD